MYISKEFNLKEKIHSLHAMTIKIPNKLSFSYIALNYNNLTLFHVLLAACRIFNCHCCHQNISAYRFNEINSKLLHENKEKKSNN